MTLLSKLEEAAFWEEEICVSCGGLAEEGEVCCDCAFLVPAQVLKHYCDRLEAERGDAPQD